MLTSKTLIHHRKRWTAILGLLVCINANARERAMTEERYLRECVKSAPSKVVSQKNKQQIFKQVESCFEYEKTVQGRCVEDLCSEYDKQNSNPTVDVVGFDEQSKLAFEEIKKYPEWEKIKKRLKAEYANFNSELVSSKNAKKVGKDSDEELNIAANFMLAQTDCEFQNCDAETLTLYRRYNSLGYAVAKKVQAFEHAERDVRVQKIQKIMTEDAKTYPIDFKYSRPWFDYVEATLPKMSDEDLRYYYRSQEIYHELRQNPKLLAEFKKPPKALSKIWEKRLGRIKSSIDQIDQHILQCQKELAHYQAYLPSKNELNKFQLEMVPPVREKVLASFNQNFTGECASVVRKKFPRQIRVESKSREDFQQNLKNVLGRLGEDGPLLVGKESRFLGAYGFSETPWLINKCSSLGELGIDPASESMFDPRKDNRGISLEAGAIRKNDSRTLGHEMTHWMVKTIQEESAQCQGQIKKIRECFDRKFAEDDLGVPLEIKNRSEFGEFEEDFADAIGSQVSDQSFCRIRGYNTVMSLEAKDQEGHSDWLFRELGRLAHKGRAFPPRCTSYLRLAGRQKLFVEKCIKTPEDPTGPQSFDQEGPPQNQ